MNELLNYQAYFVADMIDIHGFRDDSAWIPNAVSQKELYYQLSDRHQYVFIQSYGVVVFCNIEQPLMKEIINSLIPHSTVWKALPASDELAVTFDESLEIEVTFKNLSLGRFDHKVNKMIMMHLAQSVALDHFNNLSQSILKEVKEYTDFMRSHGRIKLGKRKALKFIGKSLTAKNDIAEYLYIFDSPEVTWNDEYLDNLHQQLSGHFELSQRYRSIENTLKIIDDNLAIYMTYNDHRESSRLEWIIIILIVIEVLDTLLSKLL